MARHLPQFYLCTRHESQARRRIPRASYHLIAQPIMRCEIAWFLIGEKDPTNLSFSIPSRGTCREIFVSLPSLS